MKREQVEPGIARALRCVARQSWIRQGIRNRLIRALSPVDPTLPQPFVAPLWGYEFEGDLRNLVDRAVYFFGHYEPGVLALMERWLSTQPGAVALDIGANVGHHTLFLTRLCREVHAFEPFAPVRDRLLANLRRNRIENCRVHGLGLSDRPGSVAFAPPTADNLGSGHIAAAGARTPVAIDLARGDDLLDAATRSSVALIKCDVEGHESFALQGLEQTLRQARPAIFVELSERTKIHLPTFDALFRLLPENYVAYDIGARQIILWLFERQALKLSPARGRFDGEMVMLIPREREERLRDLIETPAAGRSPRRSSGSGES